MPALTRSESSIERAVVAYAGTLGVKTVKLTGRYGAGWPDRMFFVPGGRPLFVEFKREGARPTALQSVRIAWLRQAGYAVEVVDNVEEGRRLVAEAVDAARVPTASR